MATNVVIGGQKIGKWRASWLLCKESWRFLMADKELLFVPIISVGLTMVLLALLTVVAFVINKTTFFSSHNYGEYLFAIGVYIITAYTFALAQATVVHIVYTRAHGGNATLAQGLSATFAKWSQLLLWALIMSTVGLILRVISERSKIIGVIVAALLGAAWSIMTYFVIPVILVENKTPFKAIPRSVMIFRKNWGDTLVANISLGLVFFLINLLGVLIFLGLIVVSTVSGSLLIIIGSIILGILWLIVTSIIQTTMQIILRTLLYVYVADGIIPANFNRELLENILANRITLAPAPMTPMPGSEANFTI